MDPFVGIGHSAVAAKQFETAWLIGFEIDENYPAEAWVNLEEHSRRCSRVVASGYMCLPDDPS